MAGSDMARTRIEALTAFLDAQGVDYETVEHDETYTALAEAEASHRRPAEVAKTVVLHDVGAHLLAVVPASERIDLHKLRDVLDADPGLRLATEEEVSQDFPDYEVGATPPVGAMTAAEVVDRRLLDSDRVLIAGGDHRHGVLIDARELIRLADATVADICED